MENNEQQIKTCTKCGKELPATLEYFHRDSGSKGGLHRRCKTCVTAGWREREERHRSVCAKCAKAHQDILDKLALETPERKKEREKERLRDRYRANPEKARERTMRSYYKHQEKRQESRRRYHEQNLEKERAYGRAYNKAHPERVRAMVTKRRQLKKATADGPIDYEAIRARFGLVCHICGEQVSEDDLVYDHVIPLSKGGGHVTENLAVAHKVCNMKKNSKVVSKLIPIDETV